MEKEIGGKSQWVVREFECGCPFLEVCVLAGGDKIR